MAKNVVAIVSYNSIPPYKDGCELIKIDENNYLLILSKTFNPKCPANVLATDLNWVELMAHKNELKKVIIFAGKDSSGGMEIVDLAIKSFKDEKELLYFVLCKHDTEAKKAKLDTLEIEYYVHMDEHIVCQEVETLLRVVEEYLQKV